MGLKFQKKMEKKNEKSAIWGNILGVEKYVVFFRCERKDESPEKSEKSIKKKVRDMRVVQFFLTYMCECVR